MQLQFTIGQVVCRNNPGFYYLLYVHNFSITDSDTTSVELDYFEYCVFKNRIATHHLAAILRRGSSTRVKLQVWASASPEVHRVSHVSRPEAVLYFIGGVLDIQPKATVAQIEATVVSRCFAGSLVQARNRCSNRFCGLRNNPSDVWSTDALAAGVLHPI